MPASTALEKAREGWLRADVTSATAEAAFDAGWDAHRWHASAEQHVRIPQLEKDLETSAADTVYARVVASLASRHQTGADVVERPWSITEKAAVLVAAIKQALPADALPPMTLELLLQVFTAAFAVQTAPQFRERGADPASVYLYAGVLLGQDGDADGRDLAEAIRTEAEQEVADMDFVLAARALTPLYQELDGRQREIATSLPRSIVAQLASAEQRWQLG